MPILVELPRICLSSLVNVCFPKCVDSHMHVRFARPSFASDIDNLSVTAVPSVTGTDWNHSESDAESDESGDMCSSILRQLTQPRPLVRSLHRALLRTRMVRRRPCSPTPVSFEKHGRFGLARRFRLLQVLQRPWPSP